MRIALLYHQFIARGGLEGYLLEFARRLLARGHELELVCSRIDESFRSLGASVRLLPAAPAIGGWLLKRFADRSAQWAGKCDADVVLGFGRTHCQDIHRAGGGCHAVYSRMLPWMKRWRMKNRVELALERKLYTGGGTKHFVVNSSQVASELQEEYRVHPDRISVIHTGVDAAHFAPAPDAAAREEIRRRISASSASRRVLLFVSLDHRRKGLDALLGALPYVPEAELWIAGAPLGRTWTAKVEAAGLRDRVISLGRLADVRPCYQAADVFVHPTLYDACANTVLQSMACGLPGIISARDGARDFVLHGENGFLLSTPQDAGQLSALIRQAVHADLPALGRKARQRMESLTWDRHVDCWMELIANVRR